MDAGTVKITVLPLCFALSSRKEPHWVPTHPSDITVAPGKAYYCFSPQLTEGIRRLTHCCFTPANSSLKRD